MKKPSLLAFLVVAPFVAVAACSDDGGTGATVTRTPDASFTPTPTPDPTSGDSGPTPTPPVDAGRDAAQPCMIADDATIAAKVLLTADDKKALYVNGQLIVDDTTNLWSTPTSHDVTLALRPGRKNVIAIAASNEQEISGLDRGLLVDLTFGPDGAKTHIVSDATWRVTSTEKTGWFDVAFDDSSFVAPVDQGKVGIAPWGGLGGAFDATAGWIWAYDSSVAADQKPDPPEKLYARKTFYFDVAGKVSAAPTTCP